MTEAGQHSVPTPDLQILLVGNLHPHEQHDSQRSAPLIERLRSETMMINPPIVAPMYDGGYVILDGANRVHALGALGYTHILAQVASYESGFVKLGNWQHIVSGWRDDEFIQQLRQIPELAIRETSSIISAPDAIATIRWRDGHLMALSTSATTLHARNAALRQIVRVYQRSAKLHRTAAIDLAEIWGLYPDANALLTFPLYSPGDIFAAARERAYLPPGISRHIVQGRAIRVNYPLENLRDTTKTLEEKNADLRRWLQNKLANRQVRYYAEATYQFDE